MGWIERGTMTDSAVFDARVIGAGRAGGALAAALRQAGWTVDGPLGRDYDAARATTQARFVLIAVPDPYVGSIAAALTPGDAVVAHVAGSLDLAPLVGHARVGSLHPLVSLPDASLGAERLRGAWFALAGDPALAEIVAALGGRSFTVADDDRVAYHAAAVIAANHLVALLGQVDRIAGAIDIPLEAYLALAQGALDNVATVGPANALTGPVARGDWATVARHLAALPMDERTMYSVLADGARRVATGAHP